MGKCLFMKKGETHTAPVSFPANFADASWTEIIEACQSGKVPATWVAGDQKAMTINGVDYMIDIIGKNHDTYSDGSGTAPLTFQMHDCYGTKYAMNGDRTNYGGWTGCVVRGTNLPAIITMMPSDVQAGLREVMKKTSAGHQSAVINTTADKLFLLSEVEIFGYTQNSFDGEGTQYAYYAAGNSRIKKTSGTAEEWYMRSPNKGNLYDFCIVRTDGTTYATLANNARSVAFAFCF